MDFINSTAPVEVKTISCYDNAFRKPETNMGSDDAVDSNNQSLCDDAVNSNNQSLYGGESSTSPVGAGVINELMFETVDVSTDEIAHQSIQDDLQQHPVMFEFIDQRTSATKDGCNCYKKLLNKMDYFHKKVLKEVGRYRSETTQAIRQFTERYDVLLKSPEFQSVIPEKDQAEALLEEEFEAHFTNDFPMTRHLGLIEIDGKLKTDRSYKKKFVAKLKRKEKQSNETKSVRKILKSLCAASCLSEFTWLGTAKKASFSALESLIGVIVLIVEEQFPNCDAYKIIKDVVQQRTKSAADYVSSVKKQQADAASSEKRDSGATENDAQSEEFEIQNVQPQSADEQTASEILTI